MIALKLWFRPPSAFEILDCLVSALKALPNMNIVSIQIYEQSNPKQVFEVIQNATPSNLESTISQVKWKSTLEFARQIPFFSVKRLLISLKDPSLRDLEIDYNSNDQTTPHGTLEIRWPTTQGASSSQPLYITFREYLSDIGKRLQLKGIDQVSNDLISGDLAGVVKCYDIVISDMVNKLSEMSKLASDSVVKSLKENEDLRCKILEEGERGKARLEADTTDKIKALESKEKELSRREIKLAEDASLFQKKVSLSSAIEKLETPRNKDSIKIGLGYRHMAIMACTAIVFLFGTGMAIQYSVSIHDGKFDFNHLQPGISCTLIFVGFAIYLLRLLLRIGNEYSKAESNNWKLGLDFRRAQWLTDFLLTYVHSSKESGKILEPPAALIAQLSHGLFEPITELGETNHPTEDMVKGIKLLAAKAGDFEMKYVAKDKK